ncbi:MAG TPA: response regulator [Candidatus Cloacimonadota bacterium]|nr:response regulator [Candidatus Cloacimonadota bacterium]
MKKNSIRKKVILTFSIFVIILLILIASGSYLFFRESIKNQIENQQFSMLTTLAEGLDNNINLSQRALTSVANVAPKEAVYNQQLAQKWLLDRTGIKNIFNQNLLIFDDKGILIASVPINDSMYGKSFAHRAYFQQALKLQKPCVSEPFLSIGNNPLIAVTSPLYTKTGEITGYMTGTINLNLKEGFFYALSNTKIGKGGYLYLFNTEGTIIMHPDSTLILKKPENMGQLSIYKGALSDFEGSVETQNSAGKRFITTYKKLESTNWILAANYPLEEAFEPIILFRNVYFLLMCLLLLAAVIIAWVLSIQLSKPLTDFTNQIKNIDLNNHTKKYSIKFNRYDETGILGHAFNQLLDQIQHNMKALISSNQNLEDLTLKANQLRETAEMATASKSFFLANMSHEIRTPLNSIIGFTKLLTQSNLNPTQLQYANNVSQSGEALLNIINNILDFSKIEAGKLELEKIETDIYDLLLKTCNIVKYQAEKKNLELILNIETNTPQYALLDPTRLQQILVNLLNNAIKFTQSGEIELILSFTPSEGEKGVFNFTVKDPGIGMTKEQTEQLFTPFYQADTSTSRRYGGTGLGLVISNLLAKNMGSEIKVESESGKGSAFSFSVDTEYKSCDLKKPHAIKYKRALLVDDNQKSLHLIKQYLEFYIPEVFTCNDALSAISLMQEQAFDIALIDYQMPNIDGLDLVKMIRNDFLISATQMPVILMSGSLDTFKIKENPLIAEIAFNLIKPIHQIKIRDCLKMDFQSSNDKQNVQKPIGIDNRFLKIMVAEDTRLSMTLICTFIKNAMPNAVITEAINGLEAVNHMKEKSFDIVIMDVQMPLMDGLQATREIRMAEAQKQTHTPIIALTAGAFKEDQERCSEAGMDTFLSKPVEADKLIMMINRLTQN